MLTYAKLRSRPRVLRSLTGLTAEAFQALARRFVPQWQARERRRLDRQDRRHAIGGGHPYRLADVDKLLLFLVLARHGLTYELAGFLFGLHTSNTRRLFLRVTPAVEAAADPQLLGFLKNAQAQRHRSGGTVGDWQELLKVCPELQELAVDSTEQPCRRPRRKRPRRSYYSGKKKRHTLKTQVVVSVATGRVRHVSASYPGSRSDIAIYDQEKTADLIPPRTKQYADLGYQGLRQRHPQHDLRLPHKRKSPGRCGRGKKGKPLTRGQKQANRLRSKRRVVVENRLGAIKGYRLLAETWRSRPQQHNPVFRAVAAVTNFRLAA
jgi:DDE superfamily endonuclease